MGVFPDAGWCLARLWGLKKIISPIYYRSSLWHVSGKFPYNMLNMRAVMNAQKRRISITRENYLPSSLAPSFSSDAKRANLLRLRSVCQQNNKSIGCLPYIVSCVSLLETKSNVQKSNCCYNAKHKVPNANLIIQRYNTFFFPRYEDSLIAKPFNVSCA